MSAILVAVEHPADLLSGEVNNLGEKGRVSPDTVTTLEPWIQCHRKIASARTLNEHCGVALKPVFKIKNIKSPQLPQIQVTGMTCGFGATLRTDR